MSASGNVEGGFADPVFDAQSVFRALMHAMAHPVKISRLITTVTPPRPLTPPAAAIALALIDADTPVWLDDALRGGEDARDWLAFHTGASVTTVPAEARFAIIGDPEAMPALEAFAQGEQAYPDRSATLILQTADMGGGEMLSFAGPGIAGRAEIAPRPMPRDFADQWVANRARFPRGIDLVLADAEAIACLPRTARLTRAQRTRQGA